MATTLLLVRHGHSVAQRDGVVQGHGTCGGLSERGRDQVRALAAWALATQQFRSVSAVYSSVLARATETVALLDVALPERLPAAVADCALCEIHEPSLDGEPHQPRLDHLRRVGMEVSSSPLAESYAAFATRCTQRLERIVAEHPGETVLVVTHAGVIRSALWAFGEAPLGRGFWPKTVNSSVTEITYDPEAHLPYVWSLDRFNDHAHLLRP